MGGFWSRPDSSCLVQQEVKGSKKEIFIIHLFYFLCYFLVKVLRKASVIPFIFYREGKKIISADPII